MVSRCDLRVLAHSRCDRKAPAQVKPYAVRQLGDPDGQVHDALFLDLLEQTRDPCYLTDATFCSVSLAPKVRKNRFKRSATLVVSIQMAPTPYPRDLYEEILIAMGGLFAHGSGATALRHRIRSLAEQLEVRMLIIDEIHALLVGTPREQRIILTVIRLLANDLRIPLVCLGIEEANRALMTDDQLADRFAAAELPGWQDDEAFEQLLLSFESILPLRQPSDFRDPKLRQRILSLTQGVLGRICRLMETAAVEAIRSGEERITLSLLKEELVTESLVSIADRQARRLSA